MRNELPRSGPRMRESAIINLDDARGPGSHWVAFRKDGKNITYFDSFGNLRPPTDLLNYLGSGNVIQYNHKQFQDFKSHHCGHLCLRFLSHQL